MCFRQRSLKCSFIWKERVTKIVKATDYDVYCTNQARCLEEAALESCSRQLYQLLRGLKPFQVKRELRLLNEQDLPAASDFEERTLLRNFFCGKLDATECTFESLIIDDRRSCCIEAASVGCLCSSHA